MNKGELIALLDELVQKATNGGLDDRDIVEALKNEITAMKRCPPRVKMRP